VSGSAGFVILRQSRRICFGRIQSSSCLPGAFHGSPFLAKRDTRGLPAPFDGRSFQGLLREPEGSLSKGDVAIQKRL